MVVFPEPWSPTIITPVERPWRLVSDVSTGPMRASSSSWQILMKWSCGVTRSCRPSRLDLGLDHLADGLLANACDEPLHHLEGNVCLEQRYADVAQRLVDHLGGDLGPSLELVPGRLESFGYRLEHVDRSSCTARAIRRWPNPRLYHAHAKVSAHARGAAVLHRRGGQRAGRDARNRVRPGGPYSLAALTAHRVLRGGGCRGHSRGAGGATIRSRGGRRAADGAGERRSPPWWNGSTPWAAS